MALHSNALAAVGMYSGSRSSCIRQLGSIKYARRDSTKYALRRRLGARWKRKRTGQKPKKACEWSRMQPRLKEGAEPRSCLQEEATGIKAMRHALPPLVRVDVPTIPPCNVHRATSSQHGAWIASPGLEKDVHSCRIFCQAQKGHRAEQVEIHWESEFPFGLCFLHCSLWPHASLRRLSFICQTGLFLAAAEKQASEHTSS